MGKQSRNKRERQAAPLQRANPVVALFRSRDEDQIVQGYTDLKTALLQEQRLMEQERINTTVLGDPLHAHKIALTFDPVTALLDQIEKTGEVDVDSKGVPLFYDAVDGCWMLLVPGLTSMCDTFSKLSEEFAWVDQTAGLRALITRLDVQMPLFQADVDAARVSLNWMREHIRNITPRQFSDEVVVIQIRDELRMAATRSICRGDTT